MTIIAAMVEANGWVLSLTHTASPGNFASYALDPDGAARATLACLHPGFAVSDGTAVATPCARTLVATRPLRRPIDPASPATPVLDEVDNGNGTVTVRLALSEYVHATETSVVLSVAAGWRAGAAAQTTAVANASAFVAPLPIFRWADVAYQRRAGPFDVELLAFSHHPRGVAPLAAVKFTVTDGTTVKTWWTSALSSSTAHDDGVRVYAATIDPAGLTAGLLRIDAELYPWLGAMRSSDAAGTRAMAGLDIAGYASTAATAFVVGYDPAAARYGSVVLYVDPNGSSSPAAAMVQASLSAARALPVVARPKDIGTAVQALYLRSRSLAAANGQTARARSCDGARIVLAAGIHPNAGGTAVTSGATSAELPVVIEGDPDLADPRTEVTLRTGTVLSLRITKAVLRNLTLEVGGTALATVTTPYWWLDNVEVRGKPGFETETTPPLAAIPAAGRSNLSATRTRYWRSGSRLAGAGMTFLLLRTCEFARRAEALCIVGGRFIAAAEDGSHGDAEHGVAGIAVPADTGQGEDIILLGNDLRGVAGRAWVPSPVAAGLAGTPNPSFRRLVFAGNQCERRVTGAPFWSIGEDERATASYNIVEGNSFVGERCEMFSSDPVPASAAEVDVLANQAFGNRIANNSFDCAATRHDTHNDAQSHALRGSHGYRPQLTAAWSVTYGVNAEANVDFGRHALSGSGRFEYFGRRSVQLTGGTPAWPDDRSAFGSGAGGGNYRPPPGSLLLGRARRASSDRDRTGLVRGTSFASGASNGIAGLEVGAAPAGARSSGRAGTAQVGWAVAELHLAAARLVRAEAEIRLLTVSLVGLLLVV